MRTISTIITVITIWSLVAVIVAKIALYLKILDKGGGFKISVIILTRTKVESDRLGRRKYLGAVSGAALTVTVL